MDFTELNNLIALWINEANNILSHWAFMKNMGLSLTIIVGLLGVLLAASSHFSEKHCKHISFIFGIIVSLITVVLNVAFYNDYRVYGRLHNNTYKIIQSMKFNHILYKEESNKENKLTLFKKIKESRILLNSLSEQSSSLDNRGIISFSDIFISSALASVERNSPKWIEKPPNDKEKIFIIGEGSGFTLNGAIRAAESNLTDNLKLFFNMVIKEKYTFYLLREIEIAKEEKYYKSKTFGYKAYVLSSVRKSDIKITLDYLFAIGKIEKKESADYGDLYDFDQKSYITQKIIDIKEEEFDKYYIETMKMKKELDLEMDAIIENMEALLKCNKDNTCINDKDRESKILLMVESLSEIDDKHGELSLRMKKIDEMSQKRLLNYGQ